MDEPEGRGFQPGGRGFWAFFESGAEGPEGVEREVGQGRLGLWWWCLVGLVEERCREGVEVELFGFGGVGFGLVSLRKLR